MPFTLINSLSSIVRREVRELRTTNTAIKKLRHGETMAFLITASDRPLYHCIMLITGVMLVPFLGNLTGPPPWLYITPYSDLEKLHSSLLTIQATLAALTYPIVIGFVSILLQGKQSAKARMQIYLYESLAILAGLSSLFLILAMSIQSVSLTRVKPIVRESWLYLDLLWFLINVLGTIFFLFKSIEFLRPDRQQEVIKRFAIDIAWPHQLSRLLTYHFWLSAQSYGYLPGSVTEEGGDRVQPTIWLTPAASHKGSPDVAFFSSNSCVLVDVRLTPMRWILKRWINRSTNLRPEPGTTRHRVESPVLVFPLFPGETYVGEIVVCRRKGGASLAWWERRVLRWCFRFRKNQRAQKIIAVDLIFEELQADILEAMNNGQVEAFKKSLALLEDIHVLLIQANVFRNLSGAIDNFVNLADGSLIFSIHERWCRYYPDIFAKSIRLLDQDLEYFHASSYVPVHVFEDIKDMATGNTVTTIFSLPVSLFYKLGEWWFRRIEEQGITNHSPQHSNLLKAPLASLHEDALQYFIGAWEELARCFRDYGTDRRLPWKQLKLRTYWFEVHLSQTVRMLVASVTRGNTSGGLWLTDVLQKWWTSRHFERGIFIRRSRFTTIEILQEDWPQVIERLEIEVFANQERNAINSVYETVVKNYWKDVSCIAIYLLLSWGRGLTHNNPLCLRMAKAILVGEILKGGETAYDVKPINSFSDCLGNLFRQYFADGSHRKGYRARLDKLSEQIVPWTEQPMIAGRIYGGVGRHDLDSLQTGQILLLLYLVPSNWSMDAGLTNDIRILATSDGNVSGEMIEWLQSLLHNVSNFAFPDWGAAFSYLKGTPTPETVFDQAKTSLSAVLQTLIGFLNQVRERQLTEAIIAPERLLAIAKAASKSAFTKAEAECPISLFMNVEYTAQAQELRTYRLRNFEKGELTPQPMANIPANQEDWFCELMKDRVAQVAMADIFRMVTPDSVDASTPEKYWNEVKNASQRLQALALHPILLVESLVRPEWIDDWIWQLGEDAIRRPDDLSIERGASENRSNYVAHFNDIAVYQAPLPAGASLFLPAELLKRITFTTFSNGYRTEVLTEQTPNPALVNLIIRWSQRLDLDSYPVVSLRYSS